MILTVKRYTMDEWNNRVMPNVENGNLSEEPTKGYLIIYQLFKSILIEQGRRFECSG